MDTLLKTWIATSKAHPGRVLAAALLATLVATPFAAQLRVDTDLKKLLPRTYPTVRHMDTAIAKVGDLGYFSIVIDNEDTDESIRFARAFAKRIEGSEYVRTVLYDNPVDFLKTNRFLLLSVPELERVYQYILDARRADSPFNLGLGTEEEEKPSVPTPTPTSTTTREVAVPEVDDEVPILEISPDAPLDPERIKKKWNDLEKMPRYHVSGDGRIVAMQIRPKNAVTNLGFVRRMRGFLLSEAEALKAEAGYSEDMEVFVSGSLQNKLDEYGIVIGDILRSLWVSGLVILAILIVFFRSPSALVWVLAPLFVGLVWTFAVAQVAIGFLNTISAMLFVVLFGLGIDHGIHLVKRLRQELVGGDIDQAVSQAILKTGRAVLVSALTTAGGFLLMLLVDFRGFSHLGFIAGTSMLLITLAYFTMLPALCFVFEKQGWLRPVRSAAPTGPIWSRLAHGTERLRSASALGVGVLLLASGSWAAFQLDFNDDFTTLQGKVAASEAVKKRQARVYKQSLTPGAVMFAPDDASLDGLIAALKDRRRNDDDELKTLGRIVSLRDFYPPEDDQQKRLELIRASAELITPLVLRNIGDRGMRKILKELRRSAELTPITRADVPPQIMDFFTPQDGSNDQMVFIYPIIERKHGHKAIAFSRDVRPVAVGDHTIEATGDMLVFASILEVIVEQGLTIFGLSLLAMAILVFVQFRGTGHGINVLLGLASGLGLMSLLLWGLSVDINLFNMVILAAVVGMGIDSAIHVCARWLETKDAAPDPSRAAHTLRVMGAPITAAAFTTVAGYIGMIFSNHPGLRSIGVLAVIGLVSCWFVALFLLPPYLRRFEEQGS